MKLRLLNRPYHWGAQLLNEEQLRVVLLTPILQNNRAAYFSSRNF